MFKPFKRKASPRRQAIREDIAEIGIESRPSRGRARHMTLIILAFWVMAAALQFWARPPMPYRVGEKAPIDLRAPVKFTFIDPADRELALKQARENTPQVFSIDTSALELITARLDALMDNVERVTSVSQLSPQYRLNFPSLNDERFNELRNRTDPEQFRKNAKKLTENISNDGLRAIPLISQEDRDALVPRGTPTPSAAEARESQIFFATHGTVDTDSLVLWPVNGVLVTDGKNGVDEKSRDRVQGMVDRLGIFSQPVSVLVTDCLMNLTKPIYKHDQTLSAQLIERNVPRFMRQGPVIEANQIIVHREEKISELEYEQLLQGQQNLEKEIAFAHPWARWMSILGGLMTTLLLTAAAAVFVHRASPAMTIRRTWAMAGLLWITLAAAKLIVYSPFDPVVAIAPTMLVTIILVIAENQRFALGIAALHGLLVTLTLQQGMDFYIQTMAGSAILCAGLGEIRTRGKMIEVGLLAGGGVFAATWALGLARLMGLGWSRWIGTTDINVICADSLWGAGAGIGTAMIALFILPYVEKIFQITTAMALLELCDANKLLMRRLSQEAPGTFNHSLTVGIMAEAAGNAIGANGLLCRVGAYYHDVGKLSKPQYFIENQAAGRPNRHDKLSPAMSLLIIVGHVKDGIELAREYRLPWVVHQFIAQHHGTTLVEYFYHAARKRAEQGEGGTVVSDTEFRYPGPKPQTREAAIVMICDGCESVVRAIDEPTAGRIETAVHNMITKRLMDGQFNECDLTLRELSIIEETLVRTLAGIHHGRVAYPAARNEPAGDSGDVVSQPA
ncbi:MAG TPA: HDIG domain-containing protein [Phycisphaerae bacterium]|jgi:putative nucleotidyltransferase with HDIG domain|nr:HDIG domain-containing protein [Phycisphaerae bacterium]